jgi:Fur family ferric uptake transcriptional regulator
MTGLEVELVCRECGCRLNAGELKGRPPCSHPANAHGFILELVEVTFGGMCSTCRAAPRGRRSA